MRRAHASVEVAAPAERVWNLIASFRHWPDWGPTVRAVRADAARVAPGVTGRVQTPLRIWLPFEITAVEDGRSWHWEVAGRPSTGHVVKQLGPQRCRVEFSVSGWLAPYLVVIRVALHRIRRLAESG